MDSQDDAHSPSQSEGRFDAVINTVHNFLEYYEKWNWEANESDIISAFTTAQHCEAMFLELVQSNCLLYFDIYLSHWLPGRYPDTKSKKYDVSFFRNSCDSLLEKFLRSGKELSNEIVRQAVLSYISLCSEERLSSLLDTLLEESRMFKSVCDVKDLVNHRSEAGKDHLSEEVLHQQLSQLANQNQVDAVKKLVKKRLIYGTLYKYLLYNFDDKVPTRIDAETNNLVVKLLLENLQDNVDLRLQFLKVSSPSELDLLGRLANNYPDFLSALIDFILADGNTLTMSFDDKFQLTWTGPDSSLTYHEVIGLIKCLINSQGIAEKMMKSILLNNVNCDEDDTIIWSHVVSSLNIQS